jgi:hypothetical protein
MSLVVLPLVLQVDLPVDLTKYVIVAVPFDEALVEASCIELTNGPTVHTAFLLPLFSVVCLVAKTSILVMLTEQVLCPPPPFSRTRIRAVASQASVRVAPSGIVRLSLLRNFIKRFAYALAEPTNFFLPLIF